MPVISNNDIGNEMSSVVEKRATQSWHPVVLAVLALGLASVALLVWMQRINQREDADLLLADAIMDLEVNVASFHFKFDESYFSKRLAGEFDGALMDLDRAISGAKAIHGGGQSKFGSNLPAVRNPEFRAKIQKIMDLLSEMRSLAHQLSLLPLQSSLSETLDDRFDQICTEVLKNAKTLELETENSAAAHRDSSRHLVYWIFITWSGVIAGATLGLWNRERLRRQAEASILSLNSNLESQTEELTRHREHMMELVEDRTKCLKLANEELSAEIGERQEIEKALRKSEERFRMLVETMNEGLIVLDQNETLVYVNDKFSEMLGRDHFEILGNPLSKFIAFDKDARTASEHLKKVDTADRNRFEIAFSASDGGIVSTIASLKGLYGVDGGKKGCFAVITDITEKIAWQADSWRTAHLASLGEMAASVAHEINNPINGIINYARLLCGENGRADQKKDIAERIQKEGRRIAGIVNNLLLFGRQGAKEKVPVCVNEVLSKALDLTEAGLRNDRIEIQTALATGLPKPVIDPQELQRVFINLISNAQHALNQKYPGWHENKILEIHSERIPVDQSVHVRIAFTDRGTGIPAAIMDKVKQPFFSTRPKGKGTGLGLSISEGIVRESGGKLTIESLEGEFTHVEIDLPAGIQIH